MQEKPSTPLSDDIDDGQEPETHLNNVYYFPAGEHIWRQQGPYVVCKNCELHHAVYVGVDKIMTGEKDGEPILRDKASI